MKVAFVNPFLQAASEVLESELGGESERGELGNVITGRAGVLLSEAGYPSNITPPAVVVGTGTMVTTLELNRLVLPLHTEVGNLEIQIVLRAAA